MELNERTKKLMCYFVLPVLKTILSNIENDIKNSKSKWDDFALDVAKTVVAYIESEVCGK